MKKSDKIIVTIALIFSFLTITTLAVVLNTASSTKQQKLQGPKVSYHEVGHHLTILTDDGGGFFAPYDTDNCFEITSDEIYKQVKVTMWHMTPGNHNPEKRTTSFNLNDQNDRESYNKLYAVLEKEGSLITSYNAKIVDLINQITIYTY